MYFNKRTSFFRDASAPFSSTQRCLVVLGANPKMIHAMRLLFDWNAFEACFVKLDLMKFDQLDQFGYVRLVKVRLSNFDLFQQKIG
jgi:hypothetical protein